MGADDMGLRPTSPTRPMTPDLSANGKPLKYGMLQKLQRFFSKDVPPDCHDTLRQIVSLPSTPQTLPTKCEGPVRPVGIGLPRQTTFKRQNSEKRERLCPVQTPPNERRAMSVSREVGRTTTKLRSKSSPAPFQMARSSAPAVTNVHAVDTATEQDVGPTDHDMAEDVRLPTSEDGEDEEEPRPPRPASRTSSNESYERQRDPLDERDRLNAELDRRWILNLSMHFRDRSDREKFFVTFAERPNRWRRVTVSVDYRNAEPGSLEMDLKGLSSQRDKSLQIYEAIRESLPEIQFYNTVTNLKLETSDGRLHVHVTEDVNEIIPYPPRLGVAHVLDHGTQRPMACRESDIVFETHLSGFVYRVRYKGRVLIKKEIPGPDTVDEFLYEVNALHALAGSDHVIQLEGIVLDDTYSTVKGLLISYAEKGAVVDLLYDHKGDIPWERRERWARHAVRGLRDIHEEGYVQGDFTLSNMVVDARDNARIIDINRRGCPVGWEPPELAQKIASNQRISMYIGQKSDLYQLGMSLWALAMDDDEPDRHDPPLSTQEFPAEVPSWFAEIVRICLSPQPRDRLAAKSLVEMFPVVQHGGDALPHVETSTGRVRTQKQYIDPEFAVERDDLEKFRHDRDISDALMYSPQSSREDYTFTYPRSSNYERDYDEASSGFERPRGRRTLTDHDLRMRAQNERYDQPIPDGRESPPLIGILPRPATFPPLEGENDPAAYFERSWSRGRARHQQRPHTRDDSADVTVESANVTAGPTSPRRSRQPDGRFWGASEASEATPKNSSLRVPLSSERASSEVPDTTQVDRDLACIGGHPNIHDPPSEEPNPQGSAPRGDVDTSDFIPPQLRFVDSGFNEPAVFGVSGRHHREVPDCDDQDDMSNDGEHDLVEPSIPVESSRPIESSTHDETLEQGDNLWDRVAPSEVIQTTTESAPQAPGSPQLPPNPPSESGRDTPQKTKADGDVLDTQGTSLSHDALDGENRHATSVSTSQEAEHG